MQQLDTAAIETLGIPRLLLMDHAGLAIARAARTLCPNRATPILVCCGMGYNGGDGFSAARHLHGWGHPLRILVTGSLERLREEPATYARMLQRLGLSIREYTRTDDLPQLESWLAECGLIVDALLGIGARGVVREPTASLIRRINRSGTPVVAADIPSGLDADTGRVQGIAINATTTVTFGLPKTGCMMRDGPAQTGLLCVDPITMPPTLLEGAIPS